VTAQTHADAVRALIGVAVRLYEGGAPDDAALPYAVLYMGTGPASRSRLVTVSDRREQSFQVTSVGLDGAGARSVAERVRTAVLDKRPAVTGRKASPVWQDFAEPLRVDRDVTPHRLYVVDGYSFTTIPA
jgi:hypothetical protein